MAVTVDLIIIAILFVIAVLLTRDRSRAWLIAQGSELAGRYGRPEHTPEWELEHAELWLMARRKQLSEDLARIERLLLHDASMSATRQLGNRLARDQLLVSLARIPDVLPGRDRSFVYEPLPYETSAASPALGRRAASVEVLDVGGWR
jgi:hypothetical protein